MNYAPPHADGPNTSDLRLSRWPSSPCFRPTVEAISADICFCVGIPELTSCFPQTENATAMCVCAAVSHAAFAFRGRPRHLKSIDARTFRTYVRQFVSSPEGCKLKNTWLLCGVVKQRLGALLLTLQLCATFQRMLQTVCTHRVLTDQLLVPI